MGTNLGQSSGSFTEKDKLANLYQTWEKGNKLNIGVDIALFNNKLQVTADYFNDKYYDLLQARGKCIFPPADLESDPPPSIQTDAGKWRRQ